MPKCHPFLSELPGLHERFIRESKFIRNASPRTLRFLTQSWNSFARVMDLSPEVELSPGGLKDYVINLRSAGTLKPVSVNTYIRGVNCFLTWLHVEGYSEVRLKIIRLRVERTIPPVVSDEVLAKLIAFAPTVPGMIRIRAIVLTIIDTGLRINEVITLRAEGVDMDQLVLRVMGKGRRERMVPFSPELRRVLVRYSRHATREGDLFFATASGKPLSYRNLVRDYELMCRAIGIPRPGGFHRLRHTFATSWIRLGGNQFDLKFALGHRELSTTDIYVHANAEGIRSARSRMGLGAGLMGFAAGR